MASSKAARTRTTKQTASVGLLAVGCSGPWEITIDKTIMEPYRWIANVEGPLLSISLEIPTLDCIDKAIELLARRSNEGNGVHAAGSDALNLSFGGATRVGLVRDDEFPDRFFLTVESKKGPVIQLTLSNDDLTHVTNALRQTKDDLE